MKLTSKSEVHDELEFTPYQGGIKVLAPDRRESGKYPTIQTLANIDSCIYFLHADSRTDYSNDAAAMACGYDSPVAHRGKSATESFSKESAARVIASHQQAMHSSGLQIVEDDLILLDGSFHQYLTMVWPRYNSSNVIAGVFGCSIMISGQPLVHVLTSLTRLNLLTIGNGASQSKHHLADVLRSEQIYLSTRESECVELMMQGRTAKSIGRQLNISYRTVENYMENIKSKFNVTSKQELIDKIIFLSR